ncbi:MAG TPA: ATP-binding protein, partial [Thermoanaerobaculia bacterium]|nr:ATP-binding protein [Thermoanaerobaculia bacterium]
TVRLEILSSPSLGELSRPGEAERDFRIRLAERAREARDEQVAAIRERFGERFSKLDDRIRRAEAKVETEKEQVQAQTWQTVLSGAASVAGMLLGRRALTSTSAGRIGSTVRSYGRRSKEARDVERAEESVEALREQRSELERALEAALAEAVDRLDPLTEALETVAFKPKRGDVEVRGVRLAWIPAES